MKIIGAALILYGIQAACAMYNTYPNTGMGVRLSFFASLPFLVPALAIGTGWEMFRAKRKTT
jgi:hypothetical protein